MDPFSYFFMGGFIFPDQGGVTGRRSAQCPHCGVRWELDVPSGSADPCYHCTRCGGLFHVDWREDAVWAVADTDDEMSEWDDADDVIWERDED